MVLARGTATIVAGTAYIDVPHGLASTPDISQILLTPQDNLGGRNHWPSNAGATTFRINISTQDLSDHAFTWVITS